jgi:hypothetical protein
MVLKIGKSVVGRRQSGLHVKRHSGYHDSEVHSNTRNSSQRQYDQSSAHPASILSSWLGKGKGHCDTEGSGPNPKTGLISLYYFTSSSVCEAR